MGDAFLVYRCLIGEWGPYLKMIILFNSTYGLLVGNRSPILVNGGHSCRLGSLLVEGEGPGKILGPYLKTVVPTGMWVAGRQKPPLSIGPPSNRMFYSYLYMGALILDWASLL